MKKNYRKIGPIIMVTLPVLSAKEIVARKAVQNADVVQPDQSLGRDQSVIHTNKMGAWPNLTFTLDNSGGLTDMPYLLADPTGTLQLKLGVQGVDWDVPTKISPGLDFKTLGQYLLRVNLAIESLLLQTSTDPTQFQQPFNLVYGIPGSAHNDDISENIEFLQSPQNFIDTMLKGKVRPLIPLDILNSPLITVKAGERYTVTASFKAINGLPVAGKVSDFD